MNDPFEGEKKTVAQREREVVNALAVGETGKFNLDGLDRSRLSGTLNSSSVTGKFRTKQDKGDNSIIWIQRVSG